MICTSYSLANGIVQTIAKCYNDLSTDIYLFIIIQQHYTVNSFTSVFVQCARGGLVPVCSHLHCVMV